MKMKLILAVATLLVGPMALNAKETIRINEAVTTHIVLPENIKLVDISTSKIFGNQCADNVVRIKPNTESDTMGEDFYDGEIMGTVTLIGERHMVQYDVAYTLSPSLAASILNVQYSDLESYSNPEVSMPRGEMSRYCWAIYGSERKFNNVVSNKNGLKAIVNNIYTIGDYFFIDYSLINKTKIPYDIAEVRVSLTDKKEAKATNSQTIELQPVYSLMGDVKRFKKDYRNILVLDKLTYPEEKVLRIEISENQISGRVIVLTLEYEDILNADGFTYDALKRIKNQPVREIPVVVKDKKSKDNPNYIYK